MAENATENMPIPSPDAVRQYLTTHTAQPPNMLMAWAPLGLLIVVFIFALSSDSPAASLLPWLALGAIIIFSSLLVRRARELEDRANQVQELAMLRYHRQGLTQAWELLPDVVQVPELHGRTVAVIAHLFDQLQSFDAAIISYSFLIDRLPDQHPASTTLRLHRTIVQLANDQLADADDGLRRLRHLGEEKEADKTLPLNRALYTLARLFQIVQTGHYHDAANLSSQAKTSLKPLGVEAGLGYAFLALSYHHLAQRAATSASDSADSSDRASSISVHAAAVHNPLSGQTPDQIWETATTFWADATLLLPVGELIHRYSPLGNLQSFSLFNDHTQSASPPV